MLDPEAFLDVVRDTPLVSIDLLVRDGERRLLMGLRTNEPARGAWFVPGGRILKDETLEEALARIARSELGLTVARSATRLVGVFTHRYDTNFAGAPGISTHYVMLAHELAWTGILARLPLAQHTRYRWWTRDEAHRSGEVHPDNLPYFADAPAPVDQE